MMFIEELAALMLGLKDEYDNNEITALELEEELIEQFKLNLIEFEHLAENLVKLTQPFLKGGERHYCFGELMENGVFRSVFRVVGE